MKIAIYGLSSVFGGVERFILNLSQQIGNNAEIYFLTNTNSFSYLKVLRDNEHIISYTSRKNDYRKHMKELNEIFKVYDFDILWFNCCTLSNIDEVKIAKKYNVKKIIVHSHNGKNMGNKLTNILHNINKHILGNYVTDVFACSDIAAQFMFPSKLLMKSEIINNAIDCLEYRYTLSKSLELKKKFGFQGHTVIGHVGRFHEQKNHKFLIDIFYEYLKINPNAILLLCGDGELYKEIVKYVELKKIQEKVYFLGHVEEMVSVYALFDLFLFPSKYEGLPFALIEAQAAGIHCLVSDRISDEIKITDLVRFEDIDESPQYWASELALLDTEKVDTYELMCSSGYDLNNNTLLLEKVLNIKE